MGRMGELIYKDLSYVIVGVLFSVHNELGRFGREKQYSFAIAKKFDELNLSYKREFVVGDSGNRLDFLVEDKVVLELKAKGCLLSEDYYQVKRYLDILDKKLGILVNFRNRHIIPKRIINSY